MPPDEWIMYAHTIYTSIQVCRYAKRVWNNAYTILLYKWMSGRTHKTYTCVRILRIIAICIYAGNANVANNYACKRIYDTSKKKPIRTNFTWELYLSALVVSPPYHPCLMWVYKVYVKTHIDEKHEWNYTKKKHGWKKYYGRRQSDMHIELLRSARNPKHLTRECLYNTSTYVFVTRDAQTPPRRHSVINWNNNFVIIRFVFDRSYRSLAECIYIYVH